MLISTYIYKSSAGSG